MACTVLRCQSILVNADDMLPFGHADSCYIHWKVLNEFTQVLGQELPEVRNVVLDFFCSDLDGHLRWPV